LRREDRALEKELGEMLAARGPSQTICPSELARQRYQEDEWRTRMEDVRMAARRLVARGEAQILQKGEVVDPSTAKGPIRVRMVRK
jgi:hypothetical protein